MTFVIRRKLLSMCKCSKKMARRIMGGCSGGTGIQKVENGNYTLANNTAEAKCLKMLDMNFLQLGI